MSTLLADKLGVSTTPSIYSSEDFRNMFLNHVDIIITDREFEMFLPTLREHRLYSGNLTGYLNAKKIPFELHWFTMTLSGMKKPEEFDVTREAIYVPNATYIDRLRSYHLTKNG